MRPTPADPVLCLLGASGLLACACAFLRLAPNRLLSGPAILLWQLHPPGIGWLVMATWLALLLLAWFSPRAGRLWVSAVLASALLLVLPSCAGRAAAHLMASATPLARVQLGAGFWLMLAVSGLLLLDRWRQLALSRRLSTPWAIALLGLLALLAQAGALDALAPMREYTMQAAAFHAALTRHLALVGAAMACALLLGVPLGLVAHRPTLTGRSVLATLNLLQTVPSIALFALLIAPLAWLAREWAWLGKHGIGGTGAAPAVIALTLYALLPIVRSVVAGLEHVPASAMDAARGMGMPRAQVLWRVQLPLAAPILLAGLRVVTVQSIGLAAVSALIGAGGLGHFVFLGLGQGANDLVLLGTLAIIVLALAADALFQLLGSLTERTA